MEILEVIRNGSFDIVKDEKLCIAQTAAEPYAVADPDKLTVEVAAGMQAQLVLLHTQPTQSTVRVVLGEDAQLSVTQLFEAEAFVEMEVVQDARSSCSCVAAELTSANASYRFVLGGRDAECAFSGLFLAAGSEHCEMSVRVDHNMPDCRSNSLVKGVASGVATGVFQGLVYVAEDAQHTDARQQSRNILIGEQARITTRPQLEIYADDVKCSHGATVGQMDADAILYMRQRGLSEAQARALQMEGFVGDVVGRCGIESLRGVLVGCVKAKLHEM